MTDPLHDAVERLMNPEPEKAPWWMLLTLLVGLLLLAGYYLVSLLPLRPRNGAIRCIVPLIQSDRVLAKATREFTDRLEEEP